MSDKSKLDQLRAYIIRLEKEKANAGMKALVHAKEAKELRAELEQARAALREIASFNASTEPYPHALTTREKLAEIARKALGE